MRSMLESPAFAFIARQQRFKTNAQTVIEKAFNSKQQQEAFAEDLAEQYRYRQPTVLLPPPSQT